MHEREKLEQVFYHPNTTEL